MESLPCVVYVDELDARATNVYTSPQTEALFGYTSRRGGKTRTCGSARSSIPTTGSDARSRRLATPRPASRSTRSTASLHRDGRIVWVRDVAVVVFEEDGTPLYSQGFMMDITAQKEAEADLQDALEREQAQAEQLRAMDDLKNTLLHTL